MVRLRCTERVLKRFALKAIEESTSRSTNLLGDWYANLLNVGRSRWVLCVSERTLLPVIIPARNAVFPAQIPSEVGLLLVELDISPKVANAEVDALRTLKPARTRSRQVLGVMNDFSLNAAYFLSDGLSSLETALQLAQTPTKPLRYASPRQVTLDVFEAAKTG